MSRTLLLVDDAQDIRMIVELSLERIGDWSVVSVASGEGAVHALPGASFDAVMLDVMMPGMDGPSTLLQLHQAGLEPGVPVVFITAKTHPGEREHLRSLGAAGVIPKPFDPMTLPAELERLLADWSGR